MPRKRRPPTQPTGIRFDGQVWNVTVWHKGERIRRRVSSEAEAKKLWREIKTALEKGEPIASSDPRGRKRKSGGEVVNATSTAQTEPDGPTVAQIMARYLEQTARAATWDDAKRHCIRFASAFDGGRRLASAIRPGDVEVWMIEDAANSSPSNANRAMHCVRAAFRRALRDELIEKDPTASVKLLAEPPGRVRHLLPDEESRLLEQLAPRDRRLVLVLMLTGLRRANVFGMQWSWIDWDNGFITVPLTKSGRRHTLPMTDALRGILDEQRLAVDAASAARLLAAQTGDVQSNRRAARIARAEEWMAVPYVWPSERFPDRPLNAVSWSDDVFRPALARAGIEDFRLHDLRHTAASRATMAGHGLQVVQHLLGHSSPVVTARYSHLAPSQVLAAMESINLRPDLRPDLRQSQKALEGEPPAAPNY